MNMARTHLFNPWNDLALANGSPYYTPPRSAADLANAGACLPMWYAEPGDTFIGAVNREWFERTSERFGLHVTPVMTPHQRPEPWGWSPGTRQWLSRFGYTDSELPSAERVDRLRTLSSRVTSAPLIASLFEAVPDLAPSNPQFCAPYIADNLDDALRHIGTLPTPAMIKLPWSGAGRGQQVSDRTTFTELNTRLAGMISRQGAVEITPYYHRLLDFAMLWDKGRFVGYSLFATDTHGGWTHNTLLPDSDIETIIKHTLRRTVDLARLRDASTRLINDLAADYGYEGPVGLDFLIGYPAASNSLRGTSSEDCVAADHDSELLMIPLEINWRRTMGHVAHRLTDILAPVDASRPSRFCIEQSDGHPSAVNPDATIYLTPPGYNYRFIVTTEP